MNFIALFFLCVRMFHFIHSHRIAYLLQRFSRILDERRANPGRKQVIIIDGSATTFIIYFLLDIIFLIYCIWLMLHEATWTPGFLLLVIAALESLAIHARISVLMTRTRKALSIPAPGCATSASARACLFC